MAKQFEKAWASRGMVCIGVVLYLLSFLVQAPSFSSWDSFFLFLGVGFFLPVFAFLSLLSCFSNWFVEPKIRFYSIFLFSSFWFIGPAVTEVSPILVGGNFNMIALSFLIKEMQSEQKKKKSAVFPSSLLLVCVCFAISFSLSWIFVISGFASILWVLRYSQEKKTRVFQVLFVACLTWLGWILLSKHGLPLLLFFPNPEVVYFSSRLSISSISIDSAVFEIAKKVGFPTSIFIFLAPFLCWILKPRFSITWYTISYFLGFSFFTNQNPKILYPLAYCIPIQFAISVKAILERPSRFSFYLQRFLAKPYWKEGLLIFFVLIQLISWGIWAKTFPLE